MQPALELRAEPISPAPPRREVEGFRVRLGGDELAPVRARRELARLSAHVSPEAFENTQLLVTELVTNALRHAGADIVELIASVGPQKLNVEVVNPGGPVVPGPREAAADPDPGWGLYLVGTLSDAWGVQNDSGRQRVWFEIERNGSRERRPA